MKNVIKDVRIINVADSQEWTIEDEEDDENETDKKDITKKTLPINQNTLIPRKTSNET